MSKLHQNKPDGFEHSADDDCKVELSLPTPSKEPSVDEALTRLNGRDCSKSCWLTHKDDDHARAKSQLLALHLGCLPEKPKYIEIPDMGPGVSYDFMQGYGQGVAMGKSETIDLMEQKLREMYGV